MVDRGWQREDLLNDDECEDEDDGVRDLAREPRRCKLKKPCPGQRPEFWENVVVDECSVLDLSVEITEESELRFGASVCLL